MISNFGTGRDPDSKPPTNLFQKMMNSLHVLYHWSKSAEASVGTSSPLLEFQISLFSHVLSVYVQVCFHFYCPLAPCCLQAFCT